MTSRKQHRNPARPGGAPPTRDNRSANRILLALQRVMSRLPGGARRGPPDRILVVRWGNVGDIVVAIPAFHALRRLFPDAHLTLLTTPTTRNAPGARELLVNDRTFDEMIVYYADESSKPSFLYNLWKRLAASEFSLAVCMPNDWTGLHNVSKYILLLGLTGVRRFVGFSLYTHEEFQVRQVEALVNRLRPLGPVAVEPLPWITPRPEARAKATSLLADSDESGPLVVLHCGSKPMISRWRSERFAEVGRRLVQEHGATILLTGSAGEKDLIESVAKAIRNRARSIAGQTSLEEVVAVLERADLVVSNDTGTAHLAYAVGTPLVVVSSARAHRAVWEPYGVDYVLLREELDCHPCERHECPLHAYPRCLDLIPAEKVYQAAASLLQSQIRGTRREELGS